VDLTADPGIPPVARATSAPVGASLHIVGYGVTSPADESTDRPRRSGQVKVDSVTDKELHVLANPSLPCGGDSGGPAFDSDGKLAGIVSGGDAACASYAVLERVDAYASFFDSPGDSSSSSGGCGVAKRGSHEGGVLTLSALALLLTLARSPRHPREDGHRRRENEKNPDEPSREREPR
jgi:hypothetical protein